MNTETASINPNKMTINAASEASFPLIVYILMNGYESVSPIRPILPSQKWICPSFSLNTGVPE